MQVDSKLAGKKGKCKCGEAVTVPAAASSEPMAGPAAQTADPPADQATGPAVGAGALGAVFDDLTEGDYNRRSPFQEVYSPTKTASTANSTLKKFDEDKGKKKKKKVKKKTPLWKILLILFVLLLIIAGIVVGVLFAMGILPPKAA
ncbi:MAG: hypothetical protein R3C53_16500 [Pirellulaceae bacterium]